MLRNDKIYQNYAIKFLNFIEFEKSILSNFIKILLDFIIILLDFIIISSDFIIFYYSLLHFYIYQINYSTTNYLIYNAHYHQNIQYKKKQNEMLIMFC
jgi:hypothetical protein